MRTIMLLAALATLGCAPVSGEPASPYTCHAGGTASSLVPSPMCDAGPRPEGAGWVYWSGCGDPYWRYSQTPLVPDGRCAAESRGDDPLPCDGHTAGPAACDYHCEWVREPTVTECAALRDDCAPHDPGGHVIPGTFSFCYYEPGTQL